MNALRLFTRLPIRSYCTIANKQEINEELAERLITLEEQLCHVCGDLAIKKLLIRKSDDPEVQSKLLDILNNTAQDLIIINELHYQIVNECIDKLNKLMP